MACSLAPTLLYEPPLPLQHPHEVLCLLFRLCTLSLCSMHDRGLDACGHLVCGTAVYGLSQHVLEGAGQNLIPRNINPSTLHAEQLPCALRVLTYQILDVPSRGALGLVT